MASGPLRGGCPWDIRVLLCTHPRGIRVSLGAHRHGIRAPWGPIIVLSGHLEEYGDSFPMAQGRPQGGPSPWPQGALGRRMEPILVAPGHLMVLMASGCHGTGGPCPVGVTASQGTHQHSFRAPRGACPHSAWVSPGSLWAHPRAHLSGCPSPWHWRVSGCPSPRHPGTAMGAAALPAPALPVPSAGKGGRFCQAPARARLHTRVCTPAPPQHTGHARCQLCGFICPLRCREVAAALLSCCS